MSDRLKSPQMALAAGFLGATLVAGVAFVTLTPSGASRNASAGQVHLIELIGRKYSLARTVEALAAPEIGAPVLIRVRQGSDVTVVGIVDGEGWYQIGLPDGRLAYVQTGAIPAVSAAAQGADNWAPPPAGPAAGQTATAVSVQPASDAVPAENSADRPSQAADDPAIVPFDEANDTLSVLRATAVYLRPSLLAPQAYPVDSGTRVYVVAKSRDGAWAWVNTADHAPAYIPLSDIGP